MGHKMKATKNYKGWAFIPMIIFLLLYVGSGIIFTFMGAEDPFGKISRYVAIIIAIVVAIVFYERDTPISDKVDIYTSGAGAQGVMMLGIIVLLAGGFSSSSAAMGGQDSLVNFGISILPSNFLVPGIFIISAIISTAIGTSMGTQVAMIPVAVAIAQGANLNVGMAGAAAIAGAYFGDNLSMISDTTIVATQGVGANMKDKFKMNFTIALPAAILTTILYTVLSSNSLGEFDVTSLNYNLLEILPYIIVLISALAGMDVFLVLVIGTLAAGIIGIGTGSISFFEWTMSIGDGMESMFFLAVFSMLVSGLMELIKYYGGIDWLVTSMLEKIKSRKSAEYIISFITMAISGTTLNNAVAILITAPIAKELGSAYKIAPKRLASVMDIAACAILMVVPHDSGFLLVQGQSGVGYLDILKYQFYPFLLLGFLYITIQLGLLRTKDEKEKMELRVE